MCKICVYAICKNEVGFARRWYQSMSEADEVVVLDTGSTDGTPELLELLGARVTREKIVPWRFDAARNRSLELVGSDVDLCVCTDLDEVFRSGWREKAERVWAQGADQLRYRYAWSHKPDGSDDVVFWSEKMHARHGWKWVNPVHEVLSWQGTEPPRILAVPGIQLDHFPDDSKSRGQYLPLLELAVREQPENDRNMHYLGREYFFYRRWEDCIRTLKRHLALPSATWAEERCASMGYIAKSYDQLGQGRQAERWYLRAIAEAPWQREPWLDYGLHLYGEENWAGLLFVALRALEIRERPQTYLTRGDAWGALPYDLAALGAYYTGDRKTSLSMAEEAVRLEPENERLRRNLALIRAAVDA